MNKTKTSFIVLIIYTFVCIAPYFIDSLNKVNPKVLGIPFTVWTGLLLLGAFCFYLLYLSKTTWDSYTNDEEEVK